MESLSTIYLIFKNQESLRNEFVVFDPYTDQYKTLWTLLKVLYGEKTIATKLSPKSLKELLKFLQIWRKKFQHL